MKGISLFLCGVLLMFSTGCGKVSLFSNYRPIEQLKLVHTLGFDLHEEGLELSVCGGESGEQGLIRMSHSGRNISDCLAKLQNYSKKNELYYAHTRYILVGEDYARQGLGDIMQYLESAEQLRSDLPLFIVKGGKAKDLVLKAGGKEEGIFDVMEAVIRDCSRQGIAFPFTCGDIGSFSAEYGSALACSLTAASTKDTDPEADEEALTPLVTGYGIIDYGTLTAFLSSEASRGVNLLLGELGTDAVTITLQGEPLSLRLTQADCSLRPQFGENHTMTALEVDLTLEAEIIEREQNTQIQRSQAEAALSRTAQQWVTEALLAMRSTKCDFLGLGPRIAISAPREMTQAPVPWTQLLDTLPMSASVSCTVRTGA